MDDGDEMVENIAVPKEAVDDDDDDSVGGIYSRRSLYDNRSSLMVVNRLSSMI